MLWYNVTASRRKLNTFSFHFLFFFYCAFTVRSIPGSIPGFPRTFEQARVLRTRLEKAWRRVVLGVRLPKMSRATAHYYIQTLCSVLANGTYVIYETYIVPTLLHFCLVTCYCYLSQEGYPSTRTCLLFYTTCFQGRQRLPQRLQSRAWSFACLARFNFLDGPRKKRDCSQSSKPQLTPQILPSHRAALRLSCVNLNLLN